MTKNESSAQSDGALLRCIGRFALLLVLSVLAACGGGGDSSAPPPSEGSATIGVGGGTVTGPDGTSLSIPVNAVASDTTFRIARDSQSAPALVGITPLSPIYAVTPHGSGFETNAVLSLPYDPALAPAGTTPVVLRGEPDGSWHVTPLVTAAPGVASIDVAGLSWYAIGVCTPGDAGTFGFGIGDCPSNSQLKLEYLDSKGTAIAVSRDALGRAVPFLPEITSPTDVVVRVSWSRPASVSRIDSILVSASNLGTLLARDVNQATFSQDVAVHFDPHTVAGAAGANGIVQRVRAGTSYCFHGFIVGRGDNQTVCWSFDTDIAFRLHDLGAPGAPSITTQPQPVSVAVGQPATFSVAASAAGTLAIDWQRSNDGGTTWVSTGTATPSMDLSSATLADNGALFRAHLCDIVGSQRSCVDSAAALLSVAVGTSAPVFSTQPASASILVGETASITASAAGVPAPRIRLYQVGTLVDTMVRECLAPGTGTAASCSYATPALGAGQSGVQFYAVADNSAGSVTSATATVTVTAAASAPVIGLQPVAVSTTVGGTANFTVSASGTAPLSYQWQFNGNPIADRAAGASASGIAGSNSSLLTVTNAQTVDDGDYRVAVSNGVGATYSLSVHLTVTGTGSSAAPVMTLAPTSQTMFEGSGASFTAAASGSPAPDIAWSFMFGGVYTALPPAPGGPVAVDTCIATVTYGATTASVTLSAVSIGCNGGSLVAIAGNSAGTAMAAPATMTVLRNTVSLTGACFNDSSGWCYLQPAPIADPLSGLVIDGAAGKIYAVGLVNGTVMGSIDNGNSWSVSWDVSRYNWSDVAQPLSGILVATGSIPTQGQSIFRSLDGGTSWSTVYNGGCCDAITGVAFADANVGIAVGSKVWRTVNGGATWAPVSIALATLPANGGLYRVAYAGNNVFVAIAGAGTFLRSVDGGLTWSRITTAGTDFLVDLAFGAGGFGVAVQQAQSQVLRTSDFGATWTVVNVNLGSGGSAVAFADANTVVVMGQYSWFIRSTDGGATWTDADYSFFGGQNNWRMRFANASLGFAVGQFGAVARTIDGGQNWTRIAGGRNDDTIQQIEESPAGNATLASNLLGQVRRSTDAGVTWSDGTSTSFNGPSAVSFGSANVVMAFSLFGTVWISSDAGATFTQVLNDSGVNFNTGAMASATTAIATGRVSGSALGVGGFMRRTADAGATWNPVTLPSAKWLWAARFLTPLVGLAGGQDGTMLRTIDGGATWTAIDIQPANANDSVQFIARVSDTVAIVSTDSELKRSTDGGLTWTRVHLNNGGSMRGVAFRDANNGIAVGVELLITSNGGQSWSTIDIPAGYFLSGVAWASPTTPVIGGDGGALLRNQRSGALGTHQIRPVAVRGVPTQGTLSADTIARIHRAAVPALTPDAAATAARRAP